MATYKTTSPYFSTPITDGYLDIAAFRDIPNEPTDILYEILAQHQHRPDLLAYDFYGDVKLWWVFAVRNKDILKDPVYDLVAGQKIRIPQLDNLRALGL